MPVTLTPVTLLPTILRVVVSSSLLIALTAAANAQSCTFGITGVSFGVVDTLSSSPTDTTATLSIDCSGVSLTTVRICPSIGAGSGGATASARQMASGGSTLNYQLYQNPERTIVWGSYDWGFPATPPTIDLPLGLGGSASTTRTIYARVFGNQPAAPPGAYLSSFSGMQTNFVYGILGVLPCPTILAPLQASPTFTATATVAGNCTVSAQNIDFGTHGNIGVNVDANGQIAVTCTTGTNYTLSLGPGGANAGPTARQMSQGAQKVTYGLYRDPSRTQPWGDTIGTDTASGTGSGLAQNLIVYGRVPPQTMPAAGVYNDMIVATVTY